MNSSLLPKFGRRESASISTLIFRDLGYDRTMIVSQGELVMPAVQSGRLDHIIKELYRDRPLQYILGYTWFYDLKFQVNEAVLIPRPETEELVDNIIRSGNSCKEVILDIGTGSGCIAISLAKAFPEARVMATDISQDALDIALKNASMNEVSVQFFLEDIRHPSKELFDSHPGLIVSNPPYVRNSEKRGMDNNVLKYEPGLALFVDDDEPLIYYSAIRDFSQAQLKTGGIVWLEINENLGKETAVLFSPPAFNQTSLIKDMFKKDRFIKAIKA